MPHRDDEARRHRTYTKKDPKVIRNYRPITLLHSESQSHHHLALHTAQRRTPKTELGQSTRFSHRKIHCSRLLLCSSLVFSNVPWYYQVLQVDRPENSISLWPAFVTRLLTPRSRKSGYGLLLGCRSRSRDHHKMAGAKIFLLLW